MSLEARLKELDDVFHEVNDKVSASKEEWQSVAQQYAAFEIDREQEQVSPETLVHFLLNYAEALLHGEIEETEEEVRSVLTDIPEHHQNARYHFVKGFFFESVNALGAATREYNHAIKKLPEARTYRHLGRVQLKQEHYEEAELAYRQAVHLEPRAKSYLQLALLYNAQQQPKEALKALRHISSEETLDQTILAALMVHTADAYVLLAQQSKLACFATGRRTKATALYQQALSLLKCMPKEQWGRDEYVAAARAQQWLAPTLETVEPDFFMEGMEKGYLRRQDLFKLTS